jgi:hypothetical protein
MEQHPQIASEVRRELRKIAKEEGVSTQFQALINTSQKQKQKQKPT